MLIETITTNKVIRISALPRLDPITVIIEESDPPGRCTLTVRCFDRAWTCYWGSMGGTLAVFLRRVSADYVANCLVRGNNGVISRRQTRDGDYQYVTNISEAIIQALRAP